MQRWTLIRLATHADVVEAMTYHLTEMGAHGVTVHQEGDHLDTTRVTIDAYFPFDDNAGDRLIRVRNTLHALPDVGLRIAPARVSMKPVEFGNWEENWKSFFPPQRYGDRLLVTPSWEPIPDDAPPAVVRLDPGMAFGTGGHASTQLCLEAMAQMDFDGKRVADIGTGSGILGIAALALGAASVRAVDKDPKAVAVAAENFEKNDGADRVELSVGTIEDVEGTYDVLMMNILAKVIVPALPQARNRLEPGGTAIFSGITNDEEAGEVQTALDVHRFEIIERMAREEWAAFVVKRRNE